MVAFFCFLSTEKQLRVVCIKKDVQTPCKDAESMISYVACAVDEICTAPEMIPDRK